VRLALAGESSLFMGIAVSSPICEIEEERLQFLDDSADNFFNIFAD
jgi:hypothetical protein